MQEDYQNEHRKKAAQMRSVMDFTMGGLLVIFGIYFLVYSKLGINFLNRKPSPIDYFLGALFTFYTESGEYTGDIKRIIINEHSHLAIHVFSDGGNYFSEYRL